MPVKAEQRVIFLSASLTCYSARDIYPSNSPHRAYAFASSASSSLRRIAMFFERSGSLTYTSPAASSLLIADCSVSMASICAGS